MCKENCKKKECCKSKERKVVEPLGLETEIGLEMSGTIVISQRIYNQEFNRYEINEIFLCKEDVSKIMEIALFNNIATKKEFS
tara:strand:+ start:1952 stop:2200 length:249 start_codon:yes stop_codon:yes gene_type:complete